MYWLPYREEYKSHIYIYTNYPKQLTKEEQKQCQRANNIHNTCQYNVQFIWQLDLEASYIAHIWNVF